MGATGGVNNGKFGPSEFLVLQSVASKKGVFALNETPDGYPNWTVVGGGFYLNDNDAIGCKGIWSL